MVFLLNCLMRGRVLDLVSVFYRNSCAICNAYRDRAFVYIAILYSILIQIFNKNWRIKHT